MVTTARTTQKTRPTATSSRPDARGRSTPFQRSMQKREAAAVKTESRDDMHAATVAASISPRIPGGSSRFIISGSAELVLPASSSAKSARATIPGSTIKKMGVSFR